MNIDPEDIPKHRSKKRKKKYSFAIEYKFDPLSSLIESCPKMLDWSTWKKYESKELAESQLEKINRSKLCPTIEYRIVEL